MWTPKLISSHFAWYFKMPCIKTIEFDHVQTFRQSNSRWLVKKYNMNDDLKIWVKQSTDSWDCWHSEEPINGLLNYGKFYLNLKSLMHSLLLLLIRPFVVILCYPYYSIRIYMTNKNLCIPNIKTNWVSGWRITIYSSGNNLCVIDIKGEHFGNIRFYTWHDTLRRRSDLALPLAKQAQVVLFWLCLCSQHWVISGIQILQHVFNLLIIMIDSK